MPCGVDVTNLSLHFTDVTFYSGIRPAVNLDLSEARCGSQSDRRLRLNFIASPTEMPWRQNGQLRRWRAERATIRYIVAKSSNWINSSSSSSSAAAAAAAAADTAAAAYQLLY